MNNKGTTKEYAFPAFAKAGVYFELRNPTDWKVEANPCVKCNPKKVKATE